MMFIKLLHANALHQNISNVTFFSFFSLLFHRINLQFCNLLRAILLFIANGV